MNIWNTLIDKLQDLNATASKIQVLHLQRTSHFLDEHIRSTEISDFVSDYLDWYSDCLSLLPEDLREIFRHEYENSIKKFLIEPIVEDTESIYFEGDYRGDSEPYFRYSYQKYFYQPFFTHRQVLLEASKRQPANTTSQTQFDAVEIIEKLGRRFELVARQLRKRYNDRETLVISDEYDIQNLFHAMLKLFFDDIRPEEWTPSYAGKSSRIDFLLKQEEVIIEIKKTRDSLRTKGISDELIIDKERYRTHPNCKTLIAFIYDPERHIDNPKGLEADLSEAEGNMLIKVIINPS